LPAAEVREKFRRVKPLGEIRVGRGCCAAPILGQSGSSAPPCWTLDVLNAIRRLSLKAGDEVTSLKLKTGENMRLLTSSPTREFTNEDAGCLLVHQILDTNCTNDHEFNSWLPASAVKYIFNAETQRFGKYILAPWR
jgi:hypothetical protein